MPCSYLLTQYNRTIYLLLIVISNWLIKIKVLNEFLCQKENIYGVATIALGVFMCDFSNIQF